MQLRHYWRRQLLAKAPGLIRVAPCDAPAILAMLSNAPRPRLSWLDRLLSFVTTPFKRLGLSGWTETGCEGRGRGSPVRDAQHSSDGFWTIDVALSAFHIGAGGADLSRVLYLRLEVEPATRAHAACEERLVRAGDLLSFGGAVVIDRDADFLEIHPEEDFAVSARASSAPPRS